MNKFIAQHILIFLSISIVVGNNLYAATVEKVILLSDQNYYFVSDSYTGGSCLILSSNGEYTRSAKEHMGIFQYDRGQWETISNNDIKLKSNSLYTTIIHDGLSIDIGRKGNLKNLLSLKANIELFLKNNNQNIWSRKEIEAITAEGNEYFNISISYEKKYNKVLREDIESLLQIIDLFIENPNKNIFYLSVVRYQNKTFILWKNSGTDLDRNVKLAIDHIERYKNENVTPYLYFKVDNSYGEQYLTKPYAFKIYKEMNKVTGAE